MTDRPTCDTCRAFAPTPAGDLGTFKPTGSGECRRRAPLGHSIVGVNVVPCHPMVPAAHWCGEHEAERPTEPPKARTKRDG